MYSTSSPPVLQGGTKKKAFVIVGCLLILAAIILGVGYATFLRSDTTSSASVTDTNGTFFLLLQTHSATRTAVGWVLFSASALHCEPTGLPTESLL